MSHVTFEMSDDVAIATTSNPPAELFDSDQLNGLRDAVRKATKSHARAMVVKSDAPLFSGGADVGTVFLGRSQEYGHDLLSDGMKLVAELEDAPFPVIAAVHGLCFAAGLEIALACDFIYAADDTTFSQVEAMIGAATFLGGAQFADWHIVNRVVPPAELHATAVEVAHKIAHGPTLAHLQTKRMIRQALAHDSRAADQFVLEESTSLYESRDLQYAVGQLVENGARKFIANHHEIQFEGR
jgi:enoyl-CoA hydratase/carnithine racemase